MTGPFLVVIAVAALANVLLGALRAQRAAGSGWWLLIVHAGVVAAMALPIAAGLSGELVLPMAMAAILAQVLGGHLSGGGRRSSELKQGREVE